MNGMDKEIIEVSLDDIIPNRFQPRLQFDEQALNELAKSIRQHGIIQPLVLRKIGDKYEIIAGERRYKASYIAGLTKVPAVIINLDDNESAEVAIVENIQRKNLSPIEEARSYKKLLDRGYLTQDQLATRMGKTQATISNKLRLLNLSEEVQDALLNNKISERHARSLLRISDKNEQVNILDQIIEQRLNVRDTENLINNKIDGVDVYDLQNLASSYENNKEPMDFNSFFDISEENKEPKIDNKEFINSDELLDEPVSLIETEEKKLLEQDKVDLLEDKDDGIIANDRIKKLLDDLNSQGIKATYDYFEFYDSYQYIIKVDKNIKD